MSDAQDQWSGAVAALVRKSRVSLITTLLILGVLGGGMAYLSFQIFKEQQHLQKLVAQENAAKGTIAELQSQIEQKKDELNKATAQARSAAISQIVKRLGNTEAVQRAVQDASQAGRLVYIQYSSATAATAMKSVQADLVAGGFVAPGVEAMGARFFDRNLPNVVRYFRPEDEGAADAVAKIVNASLAKSCPGGAAVVPKMAWARNPQAATQLEVWVASKCGARPHGVSGTVTMKLTPIPH